MSEKFRVIETITVSGNPSDEPKVIFEGTRDELRRKFQRGRGWDDLLGGSGTDDFHQSRVVEELVGDTWEPCGDPR